MSGTETPLRRGWTTGACATAAAKAAATALVNGHFPDPVEITLPKGGVTSFSLCHEQLEDESAHASVIKDAGDDPDVTHGATVSATVRRLPAGSGICFKAGDGVGMVTRPGLPIPPGEPAINPVPRSMMVQAMSEVPGIGSDVEITISIEGGEELAKKTLNPRLGIIGGLSVLGTTGIVRPFSCAAWIASIHRGVDVARATGLRHVVGATGSTSEDAVRSRYELDEAAFLDMGDFAGGLLKYLRAHPVEKLTLSGGFAKFTKLAQGAMDLHSARSQVDLHFLAQILEHEGASQALLNACIQANTAKDVLDMAARDNIHLGPVIARHALEAAKRILGTSGVSVEVLVTDRNGNIIGEAPSDV